MRKTILVGLLAAVTLVGCSSTAKAQTLGADLSLRLEKSFRDSGPTFFQADLYKPVLRGANWTFGPTLTYGANVSDFDFGRRNFGFRQDNWSYGIKFTVKL